MKVNLVWITPEPEKTIAYCARISNPNNQNNPEIEKLLRYCYENKHWSIFSMASACFEIHTSRAISAQIIRHWSFDMNDPAAFQEYSQRYSEVLGYEPASVTQAVGRQAAVETTDSELQLFFRDLEKDNWDRAYNAYKAVLESGISRETARSLLPLGSTSSMCMSGTIRSWIHYLDIRTEKHTQLDHVRIANEIKSILAKELPTIATIAGWV